MIGLCPDSLGFLWSPGAFDFDRPMESYSNGRVNLRAIAVYLRVSTSRQDLRSQEPELQRPDLRGTVDAKTGEQLEWPVALPSG